MQLIHSSSRVWVSVVVTCVSVSERLLRGARAGAGSGHLPLTRLRCRPSRLICGPGARSSTAGDMPSRKSGMLRARSSFMVTLRTYVAFRQPGARSDARHLTTLHPRTARREHHAGPAGAVTPHEDVDEACTAMPAPGEQVQVRSPTSVGNFACNWFFRFVMRSP